MKYTEYVNYAVLTIVFLVFMQTCGTKKRISRAYDDHQETLDSLQTEVDSLKSMNAKKFGELYELLITEDEMVELIKETPAWKTLRIEEISDKERISINALEERDPNE
tara:strand:+ start:8050 stop:8373 length:324 start_codon:yes stop_codon:yes gene_type:complete